MITLGMPAWAPSIAARIGAILSFASSALPLTSNWTSAECRSREIEPGVRMVDRRDDVRRRSAAARASATTPPTAAANAGSSTVAVCDCTSTLSRAGMLEVALVEDLLGAARLAVRDRPRLHLRRADGAADRDGEDRERDPPERGRLPVRSAPPTCPTRQVETRSWPSPSLSRGSDLDRNAAAGRDGIRRSAANAAARFYGPAGRRPAEREQVQLAGARPRRTS